MVVSTGSEADRPILSQVVNAGGMRPPPFLQEFDLLELFRVFWRRKWLIFFTGLAVMILATLVIVSITPRYTATAFIEISSRQSKVVDVEAVLSGLPADVATMETEIEILRSRKLANRTIEELGLLRNPEFNPKLRAPNFFTSTLLPSEVEAPQDVVDPSGAVDGDESVTPGDNDFFGSVANQLGKFAALIKGSLKPKADASVRSQRTLQEIAKKENENVVNVFLSRLSLRPRGRSRVIAVSFESADPGIAAAAANKLAEFYIVSQLDAKFEAAKRANEWLQGRISQLREEVSAGERAVEEFRDREGLIRGGTNATLAGEQISELNAQNVVERARLAEAEARLRQAQTLLASPKAVETAGEVLNSQIIRDLRRQETEVARRVAELSTEYGERHPLMINARAELRDVENLIRVEIQKIIQSLRNEVAVARARAGALNAALNRMKQEIGDLNASEVQLRALEREASASRSLLEELLARSKETATQESFQQPDATIITQAPRPEVPSFPNKILMLTIAFVVASLSGLSVALLAERVDFGFRSMDEVERALGHSGLGLVPSIRGVAAMGRNPADYVLEKPLSAYSEAVRNAYTNLLLTDVGQKFKTILISSALPNEGKSSIAVSLARILANQDLKVVVLDCDLRKPSLHKIFGVPVKPGLAECLSGSVSLEEVTVKDKKSSVHLIPAGKAPSNTAGLLDSVSMQKFLLGLSREYDLILIDSAPVLAVSDTLFLGRLVDKTLLVVRWARTHRKSVELAVKRLSDAQCDISGILLSMVDVKSHAGYNYSDSGIYHGELRKYYSG